MGDASFGLSRWCLFMTAQATSFFLTNNAPPSDVESTLADFHYIVGWDNVNKRVTGADSLVAVASWVQIIAGAVASLGPLIGVVNPAGSLHTASTLIQSWHDSLGPVHGEDPPIVPNLKEVLMQCRALGLNICMCTMDERLSTDIAIGRWGVADMFSSVLTCTEMKDGVGKPFAGPLLQICEQHGISPAETIVVGDTKGDTMMAASAGAGLCIGVLSGSGTQKELQASGAHFVIKNVGELPSFLDYYLKQRVEEFTGVLEGQAIAEEGNNKAAATLTAA